MEQFVLTKEAHKIEQNYFDISPALEFRYKLTKLLVLLLEVLLSSFPYTRYIYHIPIIPADSEWEGKSRVYLTVWTVTG